MKINTPLEARQAIYKLFKIKSSTSVSIPPRLSYEEQMELLKALDEYMERLSHDPGKGLAQLFNDLT